MAGVWLNWSHCIHCKETEMGGGGEKFVLCSFSPLNAVQNLLPKECCHPWWACLFASVEAIKRIPYKKNKCSSSLVILGPFDMKINSNNYWQVLKLRSLVSKIRFPPCSPHFPNLYLYCSVLDSILLLFSRSSLLLPTWWYSDHLACHRSHPIGVWVWTGFYN